mmetsp:Transcript_3692/g.12245  ORF Transcript_3692/g.12245 Transcript_3692/m.12245 type:complete len:201 (-) Transcript_3692:28-630(-)
MSSGCGPNIRRGSRENHEDPNESLSDDLEAEAAAMAATAMVSEERRATPKEARSSQITGTDAVSHASPARAFHEARRSWPSTSSPNTNRISPSGATCRSAPTSRASTSSARRVSIRSRPAAAATSAALTRPPDCCTARRSGLDGSSCISPPSSREESALRGATTRAATRPAANRGRRPAGEATAKRPTASVSISVWPDVK